MKCKNCEALCRDERGWGCLALGFTPYRMKDGSYGCSRSIEEIYHQMQVWRIVTHRDVRDKLQFKYPNEQPNADKLDNIPVSLFKTLREKQIREESAQRAAARREKYNRLSREKRRAAREAKENGKKLHKGS